MGLPAAQGGGFGLVEIGVPIEMRGVGIALLGDGFKGGADFFPIGIFNGEAAKLFLDAIAVDIEQGVQSGGAGGAQLCDGSGGVR